MSVMLECVPNVSEGRDRTVIDRLTEVVRATGVELRNVHCDVDHHRTVFTFFGEREVVERAALALGAASVELCDLRRHWGVHPRIGALDVVPFVPLRGATMRDAIRTAHAVGRAFATATGVPVFFYAEAALIEGRHELPALRSGGFERLALRLADPAWRPDVGPRVPHPAAGATVIGARGPLIALNAVLKTPDVTVARDLARGVRASSGGLPAVRAMGFLLRSRELTQVSMNLLDYRQTPVRAVVERLETESRKAGTEILEWELVGCAPADALEGLGVQFARLDPAQILDADLFSRE